MNVFIIPSWYPSHSNPIYGTFNHEQARIMATLRPEWKVGVSVWGQGDDRLLLPARNPLSIIKVFRKPLPHNSNIYTNLTEYFSPAFIWSMKILQGNLKGIISANERNLNEHIKLYGRPEIISAQASYPAALIAQHLARKYNIPYSVTIRMSPFPFRQFLKGSTIKRIIKNPLKSADCLIATSNSLKRTIEGFGFDKVRVIHNPVDTDFFQIGNDNQTATPIRLLFIGRLEEQKGLDLLLKAMSQLTENFVIYVGGDGSLRETYFSLSEKLGLGDKVKWLGELSRSQVKDEMQKCSFFILPSRHETFGNVLLEAMSCGKPVVATRCGGPEDIVNDKCGYLCDNLSVDDLSAQIKRMIKNYDSFTPALVRQEAVSRFGPNVWLNHLENLFIELT